MSNTRSNTSLVRIRPIASLLLVFGLVACSRTTPAVVEMTAAVPTASRQPTATVANTPEATATAEVPSPTLVSTRAPDRTPTTSATAAPTPSAEQGAVATVEGTGAPAGSVEARPEIAGKIAFVRGGD